MAPQGGVPGSFHLVALLSLENAVGGVCVWGGASSLRNSP